MHKPLDIILLEPIDVLFFRDGRPMTGALTGHGAAWPLPNVISAAFHAALHRAELDDVHLHYTDSCGNDPNCKDDKKRNQRFGSLFTMGPFPCNDTRWYFPRPKDADEKGIAAVTFCPLKIENHNSSLPQPLKYPVANTKPPSKEESGEPWISKEAYQAYLDLNPSSGHYLRDNEIFDTEQQIGITIDPDTQTTGSGEAEGKIYSAHYLRLREGWRLGAFASCYDKGNNGNRGDALNNNLIERLIDQDHRMVVGGQQRICTAERRALDEINNNLPLPVGNNDFKAKNGKCLVKWVLLTPAVWPLLLKDSKQSATEDNIKHHGGWLPSWINPGDGKVELLTGPGKNKAERLKLEQGQEIQAHLVAAIVPKPLVVTGWALGNEQTGEQEGAKPTQLAVSAGAVYYFETDDETEARKLADALNWHGKIEDGQPVTEVKNRRSTLYGEKGFGIGVCGTWQFYGDVIKSPNT